MIHIGYAVCTILIVLAGLIGTGYLYGPPCDANRFYWIRNVVYPVPVLTLILTVTFLLLKYFGNRKNVAMQACVDVASASIITFYPAHLFYEYIPVIYVVFVFPLLTALFFIDLKPLVFAYLLNVASCLYIVLVYRPRHGGPEYSGQGFVEIFIMLTFMTACLAITMTILRMLSMLVENIILQNSALKRDSFTALYNHTAFYDRLHEMAADGRPGPSLVLWDIDDFKQINDQYGHDMGDRVILAFADALRAGAGAEEFCFRYGGEEFGLLSWRGEDETVRLAEQVLAAFSAAAADLPVARRRRKSRRTVHKRRSPNQSWQRRSPLSCITVTGEA